MIRTNLAIPAVQPSARAHSPRDDRFGRDARPSDRQARVQRTRSTATAPAFHRSNPSLLTTNTAKSLDRLMVTRHCAHVTGFAAAASRYGATNRLTAPVPRRLRDERV